MEDAALIDWSSRESHLRLNPRLPEEEREKLEALMLPLPGHLWLGTSGTTGALKLTALSKEAMLASAAAVNRRLESSSADVWCCVLPTFHVGGLGIYARAYLSRARVVAMEWEPRAFAALRGMTLSALVPAQVDDLVRAGLTSPPSMRAIVVGGGALSARLYESGLALGWPLLPSYGMTETCTQVATALPGSPELILLDHVEARIEATGKLLLLGPSLLTGYATAEGLVDPKVDGWLVTEDLAELDGRLLKVFGRGVNFVKIGGESVDLARLDAILEGLAGQHAAVVAAPDARLGMVIHLVLDEAADERVERAFNERVLPFERARRVHRLGSIPRTELGKLRRRELETILFGGEE